MVPMIEGLIFTTALSTLLRICTTKLNIPLSPQPQLTSSTFVLEKVMYQDFYFTVYISHGICSKHLNVKACQYESIQREQF